MYRQRTLPAQTVLEKIRSIEEFMPIGKHTPGAVRVTVARVTEAGELVPNQVFENYQIEGDDYQALIGDPADWAPDKPAGTYRDDDLWHFIELQRTEAK